MLILSERTDIEELPMRKANRFGTLYNLQTGGEIRPATADKQQASQQAAEIDGGHGAIVVYGVTCYVLG